MLTLVRFSHEDSWNRAFLVSSILYSLLCTVVLYYVKENATKLWSLIIEQPENFKEIEDIKSLLFKLHIPLYIFVGLPAAFICFVGTYKTCLFY
jgi:hypothetical protein